VADRATKEVLLRLRKARELELRRELVVERASRTAARRDAVAAETARRRIEATVASSRNARTAEWSAARPAGRLAHAARFERDLEDALRRARLDERKALAALDRAEAALHAIQRALGAAVHARQRSESLARTERAAQARTKERREQGEVEDRWRAPATPRR
jgi:hypothetical protein